MSLAQSFKTLESFTNFPFILDGLEERIYVTKEDEHLVTVQETGKTFVMKELPQSRQRTHDSKTFTKLFHDGVSILKNFSTPSSNMLFYITCNLGINQKHIFITEADYLNFCGYSPVSKRLYYQAISELVEKEVIKKRAGFTRSYWINPNILFNGDRTKL